MLHQNISTHTMVYIDAATTETLSPHILPIMDLKKMLSNIEETLPSTLHLPVSSDGYPAFLSLSLYTCFDCQQAIPTPH